MPKQDLAEIAGKRPTGIAPGNRIEALTPTWRCPSSPQPLHKEITESTRLPCGTEGTHKGMIRHS
jgi:hypothetical protein